MLHSTDRTIDGYRRSRSPLPFRIFARTADHESSCATENDAVVLRRDFHDHSRIAIFVRVFHFNGQDHHAKLEADAERRQRGVHRWQPPSELTEPLP